MRKKEYIEEAFGKTPVITSICTRSRGGLICRGRMVEGSPVGTVEPTLVDKESLPAIMDATSSYVTIDTDLMGATTVIEEPFEPEIDHTAYGVLSDLLRILKKIS